MGWGVAGKPNILLIMADQHRADVLGCNGDPVVHTPHIDRLAGEGAHVAEMHCQGPSRLPARASVLLERYVRDHGVFQNHGDVPRGQPTFVHALQDEGYHTGCIGPMHFWVQERNDRTAAASPPTARLDQMHGYGFDDPHRQPDAAASATRWIEDYDDDEPWFLWIGLPGPHDASDAPAHALERYADVEMPMPGSLSRPEIVDDGSPGTTSLDHFLRRPSGSADFADDRIQAARRAYYAHVTITDEAVGAMRTALEESQQLDDTWIIYTSGHGEMMGEHRMMGDGVFYDQATRVPLLVRPPGGASEATTIDTLAEAMDVSATIRDLAGATGRRHFEGRSLLPQLGGGDRTPVRDAVFSQSHGFAMARTERHKIVVREHSLAVGQLFDLEADPREDHNLADDAPELAETLLAEHIRPFLENRQISPKGDPGLVG